MNKLFIVCGLVLLGTTSTPQEGKSTEACSSQEVVLSSTQEALIVPVTYTEETDSSWPAPSLVSNTKAVVASELNLYDVVYLEEETDLNLGFNTADYLPEGFDPCTFYVDLNAVEFIEDDMELDLGFEVAEYLPQDFNPYSEPTNFNDISFIEDEEEVVDLGFDTSVYLPENFDPYAFQINLDAIVFIEEEEEIVFDFNVQDFLPEGFDPHAQLSSAANILILY